MSTLLSDPARRGRLLRLLLLVIVLVAPSGCAQTDADLDYTRDKPVDTTDRDHSYHGWNNSN